MNKYYFYECGKGNQSYNMMNESKESVYQVNLLKFRLFTACDYEFKQPALGKKKVSKVGKTVSTRVGYAFESTFKLDGVNVKKILDDKGYEMQMEEMDLIHPVFALHSKDGIVATYKLNCKGERQPNVCAIGKWQLNTEIETNEEDLYYVVLAALVLRRCQLTMAEF